jgi:hypothetical protein
MAPDVAALGVRAHSGWAAYCVLAGDPTAPSIVARGRMTLCDTSIEGSKQPFHHAEPMTFADAQAFIARCAASTDRLAARAVGALQDAHRPRACCILTASGRPPPDLHAILASHALIHTAEGEFYRDAVGRACSVRNMTVRRIRERDIEAELAKLPVAPAGAKARLAEFGRAVGPPWTQDEKLSALGAWLMLASLPSRRPRR